MKKIFSLILSLMILLSFSGCSNKASNTAGKEITVSAAASLKDALNKIKPLFEKETGVKVNYNFEASGTLEKQIEQGAPVDVFISAAKKQIDQLDKKSLIDKGSKKDLLGNELVLIVADQYKDSIKTITDVADKNVKLSIGTVETVPAGEYAKESITYYKLWDKIKGNIVYGKDVKQVATYVENGDVAAGIVYKSDALTLKKAKIAQVFTADTHTPIIYPAAIISKSKDKASSKLFLDYLSNDTSKKIFQGYGFKCK